MMLSLTKDELQILLLEMNIVIQRTTKEGVLSISPNYFALRDKIRYMIEHAERHEKTAKIFDDWHNQIKESHERE